MSKGRLGRATGAGSTAAVGALDSGPYPWEAWNRTAAIAGRLQRDPKYGYSVYSDCSVLFHAALRRSEDTMHSNYFDNAILGAINFGQAIAVEGTHRSALRVLVAKIARRLSLRLRAWRALSMKRMPAGSPRRLACGEMTPAMATCPSYSGSRFQRSQRWMSGVVVDPGTVGVG